MIVTENTQFFNISFLQIILVFFQFFAPLALASIISAGKPPGGYSYNRFSGPVSGQIIEVKVPVAENIAAQEHADYGYDHKTGQIHPDTAKYAHLKTVDYIVSCQRLFNSIPIRTYLKFG